MEFVRFLSKEELIQRYERILCSACPFAPELIEYIAHQGMFYCSCCRTTVFGEQPCWLIEASHHEVIDAVWQGFDRYLYDVFFAKAIRLGLIKD